MCCSRQQQQFSADCHGNIDIFHADVFRCEVYGFRWNRYEIQYDIKSSVSFWLHLPFGDFVLISACKPEQHYWKWSWENHPSSKSCHENPDNHILGSAALFCRFLAKEIRWITKTLLVSCPLVCSHFPEERNCVGISVWSCTFQHTSYQPVQQWCKYICVCETSTGLCVMDEQPFYPRVHSGLGMSVFMS